MVIVRAKFNQHWRGDYYEKDAKMPANEKQAERLTSCGVAYYDVEEIEPIPDESYTVEEIKAYLDSEEIEYKSNAKKAELLELC